MVQEQAVESPSRKEDGGEEDGRSAVAGFSRWFKTHPEIWIFLFYLGVTIFLTWPLIAHFTTSIYGNAGDNLGSIWVNWWYKSARAFGGTPSFSRMIGYPFGSSLGATYQPLWYLEMRFLLLFSSATVAWNIDIFLSFFLSGITMYYLARYLTRDRRIAFFGGLAYMVGVFHAYNSAWIGSGLAATQWIPLYILMLVKFIKRPGWKSAALLALSGIVVTGTSIHFGLFMGIFTASFLTGRFLYSRIANARKERSFKGLRTRQAVNRRTLALSLGVLLVVTVFTLPFFTMYVLELTPAGKWPTSPTPEELRAPMYIYYNGANPGEYLTPSTLNPFLGKLAEKFAGSQQPNFNNSIYVGWTVILLCIMAALLWRSKRLRKDGLLLAEQESLPPPDDREAPTVVWGLLLAAAVAFVFSLKPYFMLGSVKVPLPSRIFGMVAPWFRWYNRLAIVVSVCLILIACYGLQRLLSRARSWKWIVVVIVCVLVFAEMIIVPSFISFSFKPGEIPPVFKAVKKLPQDTAFAFYPMKESGPFITSRLMFYQTFFQRPMINGAVAASDGEAMRRTVYNPYDPQTPGVLRRLGIDYMVFFMGQIEGTDGQRQDPKLLPPGLKEVLRFNGKGTFEFGRMYKVTAPPAQVVPLYLGGISIPYIGEGGEATRLIDQTGDVKLLNYSGHDRKVTVSIPLANPFSPREVDLVKPNGDVLWRSKFQRGESQVATVSGFDVPRDGTDLMIVIKAPSSLLSFGDLTIFGATQAGLEMGDVKIGYER
jgi:hypothetical protein